MSDLRVAVICEGPTDAILIDAALKAILGKPFILTTLQPEISDSLGGFGRTGGGWCGVYRWCKQIVSMGFSLNDNPSLSRFDLIILHLDADVAGKDYSECSSTNTQLYNLPCQQPCPPPSNTVQALKNVIVSWLSLTGLNGLPTHWILCIPSKCSEAWVILALYYATPHLVPISIECDLNLMQWLSNRPLREGERLIRSGKKNTLRYKQIAAKIKTAWPHVEELATEAASFSVSIRQFIARPLRKLNFPRFYGHLRG